MNITFYRKLAYKLADAITRNQQYSEVEIKNIRYGLVCIFSDLYKTILYLLIFTVLSLTKEFLCAFLAFLLLRPFLGGYHFKNEIVCIIMSFITMVIAIFAGKTVIIPYYLQLTLTVFLPILGFLIAPVNESQRQEGRKKTRTAAVVISILLLLSDFFFMPSNIISWSVIEVYSLSVYQLLIIKYKYKL
ncbi:accessory gene regulator B family protein [Clostridium sp. BNL1100]|uniref:accessory gene regulator B family protein n=1 Tax=Clostridium sp. BNL1100 TaxID=755731 RepID=UPI00024A7345|nr:accessory gene regulator B family protein [Clostridium sp. BNL1100]AEY68173.1 protein possibly involved in post-translational modification of quorum-sensing peptides [Clostridium sp. BNL1100]